MLYQEMVRTLNLPLDGKTQLREAVRAVIIKDKRLLMIYSLNGGDYKFPGGGVDINETKETALIREVREECGATVISIKDEIGKMIEFDRPLKEQYSVFKMISIYYLCEVDPIFGKQTLDSYEKNLGFTPVWVDIDEAIVVNKELIDSNRFPRWTPRELYVLEYLKRMFNL